MEAVGGKTVAALHANRFPWLCKTISPLGTVCCRRVMRELVSSTSTEVALKAPLPSPAPSQPPHTQQQSEQGEEAAASAQRVQQPLWYTVAVCTSEEEGAGLVPTDGSAKVFLTLHGARGSSQRVQLPAQAGDFERGQEDVFRCGSGGWLASRCQHAASQDLHLVTSQGSS